MKVFQLTQADLDRLTLMLDRNPQHGYQGGSSAGLSEKERQTHDEAHRFYNYQVRRWIDEISR